MYVVFFLSIILVSREFNYVLYRSEPRRRVIDNLRQDTVCASCSATPRWHRVDIRQSYS